MKKTTLLFTLLFVCFSGVTYSQVASYIFTTGSQTYTSITGGTSPTLVGNGADPLTDEGYANNISLGFTFRYAGKNYTTISFSTNGFACFGPVTTTGFSNNIAFGGTGRPLLAPLWDDLGLLNTNDLQYTTTGPFGNRIFIIQWNNVLFDYGASAPSLSFQLRLYETTNVIEFVYHQLPVADQNNFSGGATIGISGIATGNNNYLSLNNSGVAPTASSAVATNSIITRPAEGQLYRFTPPDCAAPGGLNVTSITTITAIFAWTDDAGESGYQYAITTSPIGPASGTNSGVGESQLPINGLTPGTQYYLHVRTNCGGGAFSGWSTHGFTTLCNAASLPYTMPISNVVSPGLPLCASVKDENQDGSTWRSYSSAGQGWTNQVVAYVYNPNGTTAANDWLFTSGLNLTGGTTYRLKFKYNNDSTTLFPEKMRVAFGNAATAQGMTTIIADYAAISSPTPKNAVIDFTPSTSGVYYIGFHAYSDADKNVLILDDINVNQKPACDLPTQLSAVVQSSATIADISWTAQGSPTGYQYAVNTNATAPAAGTAITGTSATVNALIPSTQYYLHVRAQCGAAFSDWVTLPFATVPNDEACRAIEITRGGPAVCGNTTLATSINDPFSNCSTPNNTVWFKYTPTEDGTVALHLTTPGLPAHPLRGWTGWYQYSGTCENPSFTMEGFCAAFGNNGNNDADDLVSPYLFAGVTYYIMIDGFSSEYGEFCISIPPCSPAISVAVKDILSSSANVTWLGAGNFIVEYGPAGFTPGTADQAGAGSTIIAGATSPQALTGLDVLTGYDVYVRQNCTASSNGYSPNSLVRNFTTLGQPPPNDDCAGAINIPIQNLTCSTLTLGTTLNATPSFVLPFPSCGNNADGYDDDVWFKFTALPGQFAVNVELKSTGGDFDLVAQIYTSSDNTCSGTFALYQCSDYDWPSLEPAFNSMQVIPGKTYFIRVFSYERGVNSQFTICVAANLLANDNAPGAIPLVVGSACTGAPYSNEFASQSANEPTGSCSSLTGYATVWFKFVAPPGGAVRISTATGSGNTLTNTRIALFSAQDVHNYGTFNIISCDEDGGSGAFGEMSVLYVTGLNPGTTYYIQVDKFNNAVSNGTFCITVDILQPSFISASSTCGTANQVPVGSVPSYSGWISLLDAESKLIALVRNTAGGSPSEYSIAQNINTGSPRKDPISGEYYLNRNYLITNNTTGFENVNVQFFFPGTELTAFQAVDPAANLSRLRVTRQTGSNCQPNFVAANGDNFEIPQASAGTQNGVGWIQFSTNSFSNFYIHSTKSNFAGKIFLQGAYNPAIGRHKDVTPVWANVMNTYARTQPYAIQPFGYTLGTESVPAGFFTSSSASTTDIVDWVMIETKNASNAFVSRSVAFVREDGQLVNMDGVSAAPLSGMVASGDYYVIVRHRNHLGIRSNSLLPFTVTALGVPSTVTSYDFTTGQEKAYQNPAVTSNTAMAQSGNVFMMWAGNTNSNNQIRASGGPTQNDYLFLVNSILGGNTGLILNVYNVGDLNLDGMARASGGPLQNDYLILVNTLLGGNTGTILTEH